MLCLQTIEGFLFSTIVYSLNIDIVLQAIALSLQDTETSGANRMNPAPSANDKRKETLAVKDGLAKKTRRKLVI